MGVALHAVVKAFGAHVAVDGLSLDVSAGEIYGLLGANGAGKTTALRMMVGLLQPTAGRVLIDGIDVALRPEEARARVGFSTASAGLYARLTGRELLTYVAALYGMPAGAARARIEALTTALELAPVIDRRCEALSTGQKQRVSLARAVVHDPPVLVLDEPTAGLDIIASRFLREFVVSERARGKAIVLSTHYLTEAELLCDRVGLMHHGRLLDEGAPAELRARAGAPTLEAALLDRVAQAGGAA